MAFEDLKNAQAWMWGSGPFEEIEASISNMHDLLVETLQPRPGMRWLDLGCGTGGVSIRAARSGADVTGVDLSPGMIETARLRASEAGVTATHEVGDCEHLPFKDGSFDVASSSVGLIFAPDQSAAATELARVTAPGGHVALTAWRPDGGVGKFFEFMSKFRPEPPEGVGDPLNWGREKHVESLLGDAFVLEFEERDEPLEIESGEKYWDLFSRAFGPVRVLADSMNEADRMEFRRAFIEFAERDREGDLIRQSRTYLLIKGTRKG